MDKPAVTTTKPKVHTEISAAELAAEAAAVATDKKGENIKILKLTGQTSYTDYFVIVSGTSDRHVIALANDIIDHFRQKKVRPMGKEGLDTGNWVLIDFGDVIVHVFQPDTRQFYDLEGFWADAEQQSVSG